MVTRAEWYSRVNASWPESVPVPTADEAEKGVRKLYRFAMGKPLAVPVSIVSGNRNTWRRGGKFNVNPNSARNGGGWKAIVHDVSHYCHNYVNAGKAPHDPAHARLEMRMIKEVLKRGWISGTLAKPESVQADPKAERLQRLRQRQEAWERKRKRAENALRKLARQVRYYER